MTISNDPGWGGDEQFGGMNVDYDDEAGEVTVDAEDLTPEGSEYIPNSIDLGGGFKLMIAPDAFRTIMHTPEITARVAARCQEICETANSLAVIPGAKYVVFVSNNTENIRARGRVKTGNHKAIEDNLINSTLLKAVASVGPTQVGDPLPEQYGGQASTQTLSDDRTMGHGFESNMGVEEEL